MSIKPMEADESMIARMKFHGYTFTDGKFHLPYSSTEPKTPEQAHWWLYNLLSREDKQATLRKWIAEDYPHRPGSYFLHEIDGVEYIIGWHTGGDENSAADFACFTEGFTAGNLMKWMGELLDAAPHKTTLGTRGRSLTQIWATSFHHVITPEIKASLAERLGACQW